MNIEKILPMSLLRPYFYNFPDEIIVNIIKHFSLRDTIMLSQCNRVLYRGAYQFTGGGINCTKLNVICGNNKVLTINNKLHIMVNHNDYYPKFTLSEQISVSDKRLLGIIEVRNNRLFYTHYGVFKCNTVRAQSSHTTDHHVYKSRDKSDVYSTSIQFDWTDLLITCNIGFGSYRELNISIFVEKKEFKYHNFHFELIDELANDIIVLQPHKSRDKIVDSLYKLFYNKKKFNGNIDKFKKYIDKEAWRTILDSETIDFNAARTQLLELLRQCYKNPEIKVDEIIRQNNAFEAKYVMKLYEKILPRIDEVRSIERMKQELIDFYIEYYPHAWKTRARMSLEIDQDIENKKINTAREFREYSDEYQCNLIRNL